MANEQARKDVVRELKEKEKEFAELQKDLEKKEKELTEPQFAPKHMDQGPHLPGLG